MREGNTNSSRVVDDLKEKRIVPSKRWSFTAFDKMEMMEIKKKVLLEDMLYIIGTEMCPTTKKVHYQGYLESDSKIRPTEKFGTITTHWEKSKGDRKANIKYCSKEGIVDTNFVMRKPIIDPMTGLEYKDWQKEILEIIDNPVDNRKIYWYWEDKGGVGKSVFTKHLCMKRDAYPVSGKSGDIKYAIKQELEERDIYVIIFDVPRDQKNMISYTAIEEIKNGCVFSTKFESGKCIFNPPHVIVFANCEPDIERLSKDRWIIKEIN